MCCVLCAAAGGIVRCSCCVACGLIHLLRVSFVPSLSAQVRAPALRFRTSTGQNSSLIGRVSSLSLTKTCDAVRDLRAICSPLGMCASFIQNNQSLLLLAPAPAVVGFSPAYSSSQEI